MSFVLFILVNVVLIIRPTEIIPGLENLPIFNVIMLGALAAAARTIVGQLTAAALAARPITVGVLGYLAAIVLSHLMRGEVVDAIVSGTMFAKLVLYYLLIVANLNTGRRLRMFLCTVCLLMQVQAGLGALQCFGYIDHVEFRPHMELDRDQDTGEVLQSRARLCGAGIFHDPNDLCVLMVLGVAISLYLLREPRLGPVRFGALIPLGVFLMGIPLTYSRGGMLALLGALATLTLIRLGPRRGLLLSIALVPVLLAAVGGRMARFELDNPNDTGQLRIHHWSDGLMAVRASPLFGIGQGRYVSVAGIMAHNSYIEAYTETGFLGGTLFTGMFAYAAWALIRVGRRLDPVGQPTLARVRPYLLASVIALMVGMLSLSRNYVQPPYLVLGLVTAHLQLARVRIPKAVPQLTGALAVRWTGASFLVFVGLNVVTFALIHRS